VLLYEGAVATTFFSSTTGGKTAAKHHEWGGTPLGYLVSVPDPHDRISPHHSWGPRDAEDDCPGGGRDCVWTGAQVRKLLSAPAGLRDLTVTRNASSRVATARAVGSAGSATFSGATMRARLGLRSTWFTIGVLRLRGGGTIDKGERKTLAGFTRNVGSVTLQRRPSGETAWTTVKSVSGAFRARVRPGVTTFYRLASPSGTTAAVRVAVRSQLRFAAEQAPGALAGVAIAAGEGQAIQVQRREDGRWTTVGTAVVRPGGSWTARFDVTPGVYRAYVAPGRGEPVATSPRVTIVAG
jgi:stage II sporulation protein D